MNRIEGPMTGSTISIQVNGKPFNGFVVRPQGPMLLIPAGPIDWANVYVRRP